jgi:hypothetical protein
VNALAKPEVGKYLNEFFVATYQKVGTFRKVGEQKQGGNVASYFCTPKGQVLHVLPGPVDAATMLREARWVVETWKMGLFESSNKMDSIVFKKCVRQAHTERLSQEYGVTVKSTNQPYGRKAGNAPMWQLARNPAWNNSHRGMDNQGQAHQLLARYPLVKIEKIYKWVFEKILHERVSTMPVEEAG